MAEKTLFDEAWDQWRRDLTNALMPATGGTIAVHIVQVLREVGAFDPEDGRIIRDWALALMTEEEGYVRRLSAGGLTDVEVHRLITLVQRHSAPAAGG